MAVEEQASSEQDLDHDQGLEITAIFRQKWGVYRRVIDLNYLNHREVIDAFASELRSWSPAAPPPSPARVLDIGVGDGWVDAQLFSQPGMPPLASFTGIDLSGEALALARGAGIPVPAPTLTQADMAEWMPAAPPAAFDVAFTAFVVHHLTASGKAALLRGVHRALAPGGLFLYCDVYSSFPGASREEVMAAWKVKFHDYHGLTLEERHDLWDGHVSKYDIPEELGTMEGMLGDAGFVEIRNVYDDGFYVTVFAARKAVT